MNSNVLSRNELAPDPRVPPPASAYQHDELASDIAIPEKNARRDRTGPGPDRCGPIRERHGDYSCLVVTAKLKFSFANGQ